MCDGASITLPCAATSAGAARRWVASELERLYGCLQADTNDDVAIVISELATNCIRADAHGFILTVEAHHNRLTVATTDDAPGVPVRTPAAEDAIHGRGLALVEALSTGWGVRPGQHTKTVWAQLQVGSDSEPQFACHG